MKNYFLIFSLFSTSFSQTLDNVQVNIYPEYYYSGIMVELEAFVEKDNTIEKIDFTLPSDADSVFLIMGVPGPNSEEIPLNINKGDPYSSVNFDIAESQFRLFVFYNPFSSGHIRQFNWAMGSNVVMKNVHMAFQVPIMAEQFTMSVQTESEDRDQHGILFKKVHAGDIAINAVSSVSVSYMNYTGFTTMENLRAQLEMPDSPEVQPHVQEKALKRHTLMLWEPLAILGVLFLIIGVLFHKHQGHDDVCTSCGKPIDTSNKFCSNCGEKNQ